MTTTADRLGYYRSLSDDALEAACVAAVETFRRSRGRDRAHDYGVVLLIQQACRDRGKPEIAARAAARARR